MCSFAYLFPRIFPALQGEAVAHAQLIKSMVRTGSEGHLNDHNRPSCTALPQTLVQDGTREIHS